MAVLLPALDLLLERAALVERETELRKLRPSMEAVFRRMFMEQERVLLTKLWDAKTKAERRYRIQEAVGELGFPHDMHAWHDIDIGGLLDQTAQVTMPQVIDEWMGITGQTLVVGAERITRQVGAFMGLSFNLENPRAQDWMRNRAGWLITNIDQTTRADTQRWLREAIDNGWSYGKLEKELKTHFKEYRIGRPQEHIRSRARHIAVTELAEAYCEGNMQFGWQLQEAGVFLEKQWSTVKDDRVSDGCAANEAVGWIPLGNSFPSGHDRPPRFPGCRCDVLMRRAAGL